MARAPDPTNKLSDAEKRDLIELIQADKPLPEKYRFLLFEDKHEVELVWNGKSPDVCNAVLPFQSLEHVDEPRTETRMQGELFDARGRQRGGWTNKLIWGDNKLILSSLKSGALRRQIEEAGGLKLIYIDPPFDMGADFSMDVEIGGETFHKEPNILEQIAYRDTWGRGSDSFLSMIYERLILMRDLLAEDGSIYVHCDWRLSALIRLVMDEVFGKEQHRNEITWSYNTRTMPSRWFARKHDTIFLYSKSKNPIFNIDAVRVPLREESLVQYDKVDEQGRRYKQQSGGARTYLNELGQPCPDVWDIQILGSRDPERVGYPTQKPEALVERIIKASSNEGDLVADFFIGAGTTAAAAEKLNRKWIGSDLSKFAIHTTRKRMIQVQRELKEREKAFRAFEVFNLGRYERQAFLNVGGRLTGEQREQALAEREREFRELILRAYKAEGFDNDAFFDGKRNGRLIVIGPINLPVGRLFVEEVVTECRKRGATRVDVLAFEFEMGLFPAVLEEAKQKGIDLVPRYIPPEVFDKQAVDRGHVIFHDISFVEATPRYSNSDPMTVQIELTDFSVYYSQKAAEEVARSLKNGKSEVVCDKGQLLKVTKDKQGALSHQVLTQNWTDWVDYWAVDFDYESKKEIIKVPVGAGPGGVLTGFERPQQELPTDFEDRWTGNYIFENEWQSFRKRKQRELSLITASHRYEQPGRYTVAVKVVDIFGNDTMTLVPVTVG
jgi:site-specific DNA-methyltransferase (adenine-specific)/adenine-specific DNA-methyltransferase